MLGKRQCAREGNPPNTGGFGMPEGLPLRHSAEGPSEGLQSIA